MSEAADRYHWDGRQREPRDWHHLVLCFKPDGSIDFFPETADPAMLAGRLRALVRLLLEAPSMIELAAGLHGVHPHRDE